MRIGFLANNLNLCSGGGASFENSIFSNLYKIDMNFEFYIFYNTNEKVKANKNIKFIQLKTDVFTSKAIFKKQRKKLIRNKKREFRLKYKSFLNKACKENKIDLFWFLSPIGVQEVDIPYVMTVWDLQHRLHPYFPEVSVQGWTFENREIFYQKYLPKATYIIIGNATGKNQVIDFYNIPEFRVKTIFMPVSDIFFENFVEIDIKKKYKIKSDYIFYPAQFWPHKNHIRILKAIKSLNLSAVFTGSDKGNENYIKKCVEEMGLKDKVYFLGFVSCEELMSLYKQAKALVFPSFFGPDNIPPLEAMALKCPVICSNADGMEEQLNDCALFFNPLKENEIVKNLKMLDDNMTKNSLTEKGYNMALTRKSSKYVMEIVNILNGFKKIRECWD
jgi:glycosyltransferase involved in cell wall biosynthesis